MRTWLLTGIVALANGACESSSFTGSAARPGAQASKEASTAPPKTGAPKPTPPKGQKPPSGKPIGPTPQRPGPRPGPVPNPSTDLGQQGAPPVPLPSPTPAPQPTPHPPDLPPAGNNSVTKGSFTIWTDPASPQPEQSYTIHVEMKLPSSASLPESDVSGVVNGSEGYQQEFGPQVPPDQFTQSGAFAQFQIWVPGGADFVHDTIKVSSKLLNETQTIGLTFQP